MSDEDRSGYRVGKCRPPLDGRFTKGKSGNPKGRPRTKERPPELPQSISSSLLKILDGAIPVTRGERRESLSKREAIMEQLTFRALKGDVRAAALLFQYAHKAEMHFAEIKGKLFSKALELKLERTLALRSWLASGRSEENFPCHPDDIALDPVTLSVKLPFPLTREDEAVEQQLLEHRSRLQTVIALLGSKPKDADQRDALENEIKQIDQLLRPSLRRNNE
jgi:hypothetical protein